MYQHSKIERHYETMPLEEILAMKVPRARDSGLFLWCPPALLEYGLATIKAWMYHYVTNQTWVKLADRPGLGYRFRMEHEHLLFAKRGAFKSPPPKTRPSSIIYAKTREHSRKPDNVYDMIERCYPDHSKIELFARASRSGWTSWGNEIGKYKASTLSRYEAPEKKVRAALLDDFVPKPVPKPRRRRQQ